MPKKSLLKSFLNVKYTGGESYDLERRFRRQGTFFRLCKAAAGGAGGRWGQGRFFLHHRASHQPVSTGAATRSQSPWPRRIGQQQPQGATGRFGFVLKKEIQKLAYLKDSNSLGTSLVAQWLGIRLPTQGTRVRALVQEDPTCHGATKPVRHNC